MMDEQTLERAALLQQKVQRLERENIELRRRLAAQAPKASEETVADDRGDLIEQVDQLCREANRRTDAIREDWGAERELTIELQRKLDAANARATEGAGSDMTAMRAAVRALERRMDDYHGSG